MANNYQNHYIHDHCFPAAPTSAVSTFPTVVNIESESSPRGFSRSSENSQFSDVVRELQHVDSNGVVTSRAINISDLFTSSAATQSVINNHLSDSVILNLDHGAINRSAPSSLGGVPVNEELSNISSSHSNPSLNADTVRNVIDSHQSLQYLAKYSRFCLILLAKFLYDHCEGIFNVFLLCATFIYANNIVRRESTAQVRRSLLKLFASLLCIFTCFAYIAYIFEDEKLYLNLVFIPPCKLPSTAWDLLWVTAVTDLILKLVTVIFKIILTMLPACIIQFPKRGRVYLFIEALSQLYRSLATIQPWLFYLLESYEGADKVVGVLLSAAYMVSKGNDLMSRLKLFRSALIKLIRNTALGSQPNKEQIQNAGNCCPICHDAYDSPVLLECHHIFCESCVSIWFDREQTCPLCRAKIVDDPSWRDGSTTFFMQLY